MWGVRYFASFERKHNNDRSTKITKRMEMKKKKLFYYSIKGTLLQKFEESSVQAISECKLPKRRGGTCSPYCEHIDRDLKIGEKRDIAILDPIFLGMCRLIAKDERSMMSKGSEEILRWRNYTTDGNVWTWRLPKKLGGKLVFVPQNQTTEAKNAKN